MIRKIINGMVYDGTGEKAFPGGVEIENGRITKIIRGRSEEKGDGIIDAGGMAITPGFVDIHRHHDLAALFDETFGEIELAQGITTAIAGNCGLGAFPNSDEFRQAQFSYIEPVMGKVEDGCEIRSFGQYLEALETKGLPLRMGSLTGVGATVTAVKGYAPRPMTDEEREKAVQLVKEAMEAGAVGLSFGIMYSPECFLSKEDYVAMAAECARHGGVICTHIRGEGDSLLESVNEVIEICKEAGAPLNISHFKVTGVRNWKKGIGAAIDAIEKARSEGQIVTCDAYPYTGGATTAMSLIPPVVLGDHENSYLGTEEGYTRLKENMYIRHEGWDNMVESIGWERTVIGSVTLEKNRIYCGKSVAQIQEELGLDDPCEWLGKFIAEEDGKIGIIIMSMSQEDVDRVMNLPYACLISDSLYGGGDNPHPRLYGSFPKFIREYVNERKVMDLETAISKMTRLPAERIGLTDRGVLKEGMLADVNVFDPEKIRDKATFVKSRQLSEGIAYTIIGGEIAAVDSVMTKGRFGSVTRK